MTLAKRFGMRQVVLAFVVLAGLVSAARRGAADAPQGRFTITNGGTATGVVFDAKTGLTWQQRVPVTSYNWADATTYCANNTAGLPSPPWRLPSMRELQTIVDDSQQSPPAIDQSYFPGTPLDDFWTSSPYLPATGQVWDIYFRDGSTNYAPALATARVRCVR